MTYNRLLFIPDTFLPLTTKMLFLVVLLLPGEVLKIRGCTSDFCVLFWTADDWWLSGNCFRTDASTKTNKNMCVLFITNKKNKCVFVLSTYINKKKQHRLLFCVYTAMWKMMYVCAIIVFL